MRIKQLSLIGGGVVLAAIVAVAIVWGGATSPPHEDQARGQGSYALPTTSGDMFTQASLTGGPTAVFFGFTHCPDVCPTTMGDLDLWKSELPEARDLKIYFITVDPERDSLDQLRDYVSWIPDVVGVSGTRAETDDVITAFDVLAKRIDLDGGEYTMAHTAAVMLFDGEGRFVDQIPYQAPLDAVRTRLAKLEAR
ncbi:SCO family protein [Rhodobacteraceae bacterium]|nr:SCO family protein [Paracoccaceae bacterium]